MPDTQAIRANASGDIFLEDDSGRHVRLYRFREALEIARISAATYYRWVKDAIIPDTGLRDQGKWRVFTEAEVGALVRLSEKLGEHREG